MHAPSEARRRWHVALLARSVESSVAVPEAPRLDAASAAFVPSWEPPQQAGGAGSGRNEGGSRRDGHAHAGANSRRVGRRQLSEGGDNTRGPGRPATSSSSQAAAGKAHRKCRRSSGEGRADMEMCGSRRRDSVPTNVSAEATFSLDDFPDLRSSAKVGCVSAPAAAAGAYQQSSPKRRHDHMEQTRVGPLILFLSRIPREASTEDLEALFVPLAIRVKVRAENATRSCHTCRHACVYVCAPHAEPPVPSNFRSGLASAQPLLPFCTRITSRRLQPALTRMGRANTAPPQR